MEFRKAINKFSKLVCFAHNWNNGMSESWNDGLKETSIQRKWPQRALQFQ
jgi:hypothetical protein